MMRRLGSRHSFTLIEMLIVIVIIGLLAAMMLPSLGKTRENARNARCKNNLKNLHTAAMNFANENNKALPHCRSTESYDTTSQRWVKNRTGWLDWTEYPVNHNPGSPGSPMPGYTRWWGSSGTASIVTGTLWSHVGNNMRCYLCPTFAQKSVCLDAAPDNAAVKFSTTVPVVRNYGMNSRIIDWELGLDANKSPVQSSRTVLFADMASVAPNLPGFGQTVRALRSPPSNRISDSDAWDGAFSGVTNSAGQLYESLGNYHAGRANVVFIDGHVETLWPTNTLLIWKSEW